MLSATTSAAIGQFFYGGAIGFTIADLPNSAAFPSLFDRYRIDLVEVRIIPLRNVAMLSPINGTQALFATIHSACDYDDRTAPTANQAGIDSLMKRPSYRCTQGISAKATVRLIKPRVAVGAFAAAAFSSYANMGDVWIDSVSNTVEHYGFKYVVELQNTSGVAEIWGSKVEVKYHLSLTDVF